MIKKKNTITTSMMKMSSQVKGLTLLNILSIGQLKRKSKAASSRKLKLNSGVVVVVLVGVMSPTNLPNTLLKNWEAHPLLFLFILLIFFILRFFSYRFFPFYP